VKRGRAKSHPPFRFPGKTVGYAFG